jgi:endonuclease/exonuclease/phosphatase family metal-dependent hydrolase
MAILAAASLVAIAACGQEGRVRPQGTASTGASGSQSSGAGGAGGVGGSGGMAIPTPEPLTIVNWNAQNFFNDKTDDPSGLDQPGDFSLLTTSEYIGKKKAVAGILHSLAPDIAVLQEIENESVMNELRAELEALGDVYPHAALIPTSDIREIVILSKVPIDSIKSHQDEEFVKSGTFAPFYTYTRDCLEAHITYNGRHIVLLGVHFRSKADDEPDRRLAEAEHTRVIADSIAIADPEAGIVVLGDFNDTPLSPPYVAVLGQGETAFKNASVLALPESSRWTYDYKGQLELIDHQMSNPVLAQMLDEASIQILHTPAAEDASDHAPVIATYKVY